MRVSLTSLFLVVFVLHDVLSADDAVRFERDVLPILRNGCFECHGEKKQESGLRLDVRKLAFDGGDNGPAIVKRESKNSELIRRILSKDPSDQMPPEGKRLTRQQISILKKWIDNGANWSDKFAGTVRRKVHWAFERPRKSQIPDVVNLNWCRNPIDRFVLAKLEVRQIRPSPEADRNTLYRRLSLDLLGLPPTRSQLAKFRNDRRSDAYERLVNRLLSSPHFGERWGRHWLDLARYADSNGYERDDVRPNAWRYRDWVIHAMNSDLPYGQFVVEQLAGDLLPNATLAQKTATGFHRMTIKNTESGINKEDYRNREIVDRVNTTGTAFLGLTVGCAQCHSHKYDPISQRDYYQIYAFFNNTKESNLNIPGTKREQNTYKRELADFNSKRKMLKDKQSLLNEIAKLGFAKWWASAVVLGSEKLKTKLAQLRLPKELEVAFMRPPKIRTAHQQNLLAQFQVSLKSQLDDLKKEIRTLSVEERYLPKPYVMVLAEETGKRRTTHVLLRGDFKKRGRKVGAKPLAFLSKFQSRGKTPDRLDLAKWIVDPSNPMTARVAVSRVWQHLFGRGLVETADNFGTQGASASHPKLLDWLAVEFQRSKYSRKQVVRLIVTSATYRQSSRHRFDIAKVDPENELLARQSRFRVESEIIRDQFLTVSGLLNQEMGGRTIRPPVPASIRDFGYKYRLVWPVSENPRRHRRGVYIHFKRSNPFPSLLTFDAPDAVACAANRNRSNTPLQALTTLNDPVFVECAKALGRRIVREGPQSTVSRIQFASELCLCRRLNGLENSIFKELFDAERQSYSHDRNAASNFVKGYEYPGCDLAELAAWTAVARTFMNLDEFLTRE